MLETFILIPSSTEPNKEEKNMRSFLVLGSAALVAGHGLLEKITVDGTV
jgi:hypothetical protein